MNREDILDALLQPVEWTPEIAARHLGVRIAVLESPEEPQLYTRKPPSKLIPRTSQMVDEQPTQVWARYPDFDDVSFVITSLMGHGMWVRSDTHLVNVHTAQQTFDPHSADYLIDQYYGIDVFVFVLGVPDFLQLAKQDGIRWISP